MNWNKIFRPSKYWYNPNAKYKIKKLENIHEGEVIQVEYQVWIELSGHTEPARMLLEQGWVECGFHCLKELADRELNGLLNLRKMYNSELIIKDVE